MDAKEYDAGISKLTFLARLLLFPVDLQALWCLAAVKIADGQISYYDSLGQT